MRIPVLGADRYLGQATVTAPPAPVDSVPGDAELPHAGSADPAQSRRAAAVHWLGAVLRTHWIFALVLAAGAAGRVLTMVAYGPALLYIDSFRYLDNMASLKPTGTDPMGYPLVLRLLLDVGNLQLVVGIRWRSSRR
jgi:hypothetical protein